MTYVKKTNHTKLYLAIILMSILIVAGGAVIYTTLTAPIVVNVGVNVGDTFTYSIKGTSEFADPTTPDTPGFWQYNQTDYYKITVTGINNTIVSMDTTWRFVNGTEIAGKQSFNIATGGNKTDENSFWAIYPSGLKANDKLRPLAPGDVTHVNKTETKTFTSGARESNFWFINNEFYDQRDPTRSTLMYDYRNIYFDKETGMLTSLDDYMVYNNPQMQEVVSWLLIDTSVWKV